MLWWTPVLMVWQGILWRNSHCVCISGEETGRQEEEDNQSHRTLEENLKMHTRQYTAIPIVMNCFQSCPQINRMICALDAMGSFWTILGLIRILHKKAIWYGVVCISWKILPKDSEQWTLQKKVISFNAANHYLICWARSLGPNICSDWPWPYNSALVGYFCHKQIFSKPTHWVKSAPPVRMFVCIDRVLPMFVYYSLFLVSYSVEVFKFGCVGLYFQRWSWKRSSSKNCRF